MISILLQLVIAALIVGLIIWLCTQLPFLQPFANIIRMVAIVLFIIWVIYLLMGFIPHGGLR